MADYIEGRRAVEEALRAGVPIKRVLVQSQPKPQAAAPAAKGRDQRDAGKPGKPGKAGGRQAGRARDARLDNNPRDERASAADQSLEHLLGKLRAAGVEVQTVDRESLDRISSEGGSHGAHQGIVCEVPNYRYAELMDIARAGAQKDNSLVLVLDHITDEGNLGAIIRTAEVLGADGVVIPSKRAAQVTVGVYKTSAGAAFHIPIARVPNLVAALKTLKTAGFWVAGASEHAREDIWHAPLQGRIALVAGSEGDGMSRLVSEECDFLVSLPQRGHVGSLNVAQATTAICYEWLRRCSEQEAAAAQKAARPRG